MKAGKRTQIIFSLLSVKSHLLYLQALTSFLLTYTIGEAFHLTFYLVSRAFHCQDFWMEKRTESIFSNMRNETKVSFSSPLFNIVLGSLECFGKRNKEKGYTNKKGRTQTISLCRWFDLLFWKTLKTLPKYL